ncbi:Uncharacterized methyltransferase [Sparassis crispa]|uniref:Uncharacterized methyltransferase n=1 Tax=Sparassis crispa TaxID=139825 RepID=A0A401GKW8_9APHY|nr:Uncharacterized methyltransferase [Sparassis crispa]GBE82817.1 Uncharacterized methyltransferase [Sparassis crispa]
MDHHHHHHHHHHDDTHIHGDSHGHNYADANKQYFNETAQKWHAHPEAQEMARRLTAAMKSTYPTLFDEERTTVLDFACGTGLISRELCADTTSIVGVDISSGTVDQYNLRASNQGLAPEEMRAICVDLKGTEGELDGAKFDVVVCASSFHHFSSVKDVMRTLVFFLKPGGSLLVTDVMKDADESELFPQNVHHIVAHPHGFDKSDMRKVFEGAGLSDFRFTSAFSAKFHGKDVKCFLAKGVKQE